MTSPDETNEVYLHHGQSYEEKIENVPVIKEIVTAHCLTGINQNLKFFLVHLNALSHGSTVWRIYLYIHHQN